jgi:hypothetical protein
MPKTTRAYILAKDGFPTNKDAKTWSNANLGKHAFYQDLRNGDALYECRDHTDCHHQLKIGHSQGPGSTSSSIWLVVGSEHKLPEGSSSSSDHVVKRHGIEAGIRGKPLF